MNTVEFKNFIESNGIEYNSTDTDGIILFIPFFHLEEFSKLLGHTYLSDNQLSCVLKEGYIGIKINDFCPYFNIYPEDVFPDPEKFTNQDEIFIRFNAEDNLIPPAKIFNMLGYERPTMFCSEELYEKFKSINAINKMNILTRNGEDIDIIQNPFNFPYYSENGDVIEGVLFHNEKLYLFKK